MKSDKYSFKQYKNWTLEQASTRKGALDILSKPSRIVNTLFYPNGSTKHDAKSN